MTRVFFAAKGKGYGTLLFALMFPGVFWGCGNGERAAAGGRSGAKGVAELPSGIASGGPVVRDGKEGRGAKGNGRVVLDENVLEISIPGGEYTFGSETGEPYRNPAKEFDSRRVKVKPFAIDRYPYPNSKDGESLLGVTFEEAVNLCREKGKRLCTELEWEIACRGPDGGQFPEGGVSGFGVERLFAAFEWTDSRWLEPELPVPRGVVVRGSSLPPSAELMRCSSRTLRQPEKSFADVGLRCCRGEINAMDLQLEHLKRPFEVAKDFPLEKFQFLVRSTPQMAKVAADPQMFGESDLRYALLRREIDIESSYPGYIFTTSPVWWRPTRGEEILVMSGRSGKNSFVLALYHLGEGKFRHAASLILLESDAATVELPIPIILVAGLDRTIINWGPCWNCSEGGSFYLDDKVDAEQRGDFRIQVSYRWGP